MRPLWPHHRRAQRTSFGAEQRVSGQASDCCTCASPAPEASTSNGLGQEFVGHGDELELARPHARHGGDRNARQAGVLLHPTQDVISREPRQANVEHDEVRRVRPLYFLQGFFARLRGDDLDALKLQELGQELQQGAVVVHDEDPPARELLPKGLFASHEDDGGHAAPAREAAQEDRSVPSGFLVRG